MTEQESYSLDLGLNRSLRVRAFRRRVAAFIAALCFLEFLGLPHVRWTMTDARGVHHQVTYWSVTGQVRGVHFGRRGNDPLFLLRPLERPPSSYATEAFEHAKTALQSYAPSIDE